MLTANNDFYVPQLETEDSDSSRSSCEHQTCNVSDFYISDMIVSCLAVEGETIYDNSLTDRFLADYKCEEPNIFNNVDEEYLLLPFLEDTAAASYSQVCRTSSEETAVQSDDSSLYMAIHQLRSSEQSDAFTYLESDQAECFDPHIFIRNLPDILERPSILPNESETCKPITLVLDLDGEIHYFGAPSLLLIIVLLQFFVTLEMMQCVAYFKSNLLLYLRASY